MRWEYENLPYWGGEVDVCINSWTLSNGLWLGADVDGIVDWLLNHEQDDGGWNCEWVDGSRVSSFHSTLNALLGLLDYQTRSGDVSRVADARAGGEEYLLTRALFRRLSDGEPFDDRVLALFHPRRWFYGVLPAADGPDVPGRFVVSADIGPPQPWSAPIRALPIPSPRHGRGPVHEFSRRRAEEASDRAREGGPQSCGPLRWH